IMTSHIIASSIGIIARFRMEWKRSKKKFLAHKSLTLLMDLHTFWTFLMCISTLVENSINFHTHLTMTSPADIFVTASTCIFRRIPFLLAIFGEIYSQMAMAAERYRASNNLANYENSSRDIGHWLNAAHLAVVFLFGVIHMLFYGTDWIAAHCVILTPSGGAVHATLALFVFISELVTIVSFKRLLTRNCRVRDNCEAGLTLSERYQLVENIRMLKLLLPIIWSHTSLGMYGTFLFLVFKLIFPAPEMYPLIEETINLLYLQGIFMPLIIMFRFR
ncbi:hypothetical protein PENTCL1PPCAC_16393, partial [Pristionchus entomophagus]